MKVQLYHDLYVLIFKQIKAFGDMVRFAQVNTEFFAIFNEHVDESVREKHFAFMRKVKWSYYVRHCPSSRTEKLWRQVYEQVQLEHEREERRKTKKAAKAARKQRCIARGKKQKG